MQVEFEKYIGYDREPLAKAIAWYMMAEGSLQTYEGNWFFKFDELDELFGTDLKNDRGMVDMIADQIDPDIVFIDDQMVGEDEFDLNFALMYAPNAWEGDEHP